MPLVSSDRPSITRMRLLGRGAVVLGLCGAAAVAGSILFSDKAPSNITLELPQLEPIAPQPVAGADTPKADTDSLASRLVLVSNTPKAKEQPKVDGAAAPVAQVFNLKDHVRFLGLVSEPKRLLALLAVDAKQRMLAEKDTFKVANGPNQVTVTVKSITESQIVLRDDKGEHIIDIAIKTGSALTKGKVSPNSAANRGNVNLPPGVVPMTPEQAAAKVATIRQQQRDKQMMLRKERLEEFAKENNYTFEEADKVLRQKQPELYEDSENEKDGK